MTDHFDVGHPPCLLFELPGVPVPATDAERLADYFLFRYVPEPRTAFVGIERFPAGHLLTIQGRGESMRRYWRLTPREPFRGSFEDAVAECESRLDTIVDMHLMSERPVGVGGDTPLLTYHTRLLAMVIVTVPRAVAVPSLSW